MRLEYYTPLKKGFILQSKGGYLEKFTAALRAAILLCFLLTAFRAAQQGPLHFRFASYTYVDRCNSDTSSFSLLMMTKYHTAVSSIASSG